MSFNIAAFLPTFLKRAEEVGVKKIVMPGIEELSWQQMVDIENPTTVKLFKLFGIHPCDVQKDIKNFFDLVFWKRCF